MGLNPVCPECGFESNDVRCPRCNTLKVIGCTGSCWACGNQPACQKRISPVPGAENAPGVEPAPKKRQTEGT